MRSNRWTACAFAGVTLTVAACGGGGSGGGATAPTHSDYTATLAARAPVSSSAQGTALIEVTGTSARYVISARSLTTANAAHIHTQLGNGAVTSLPIDRAGAGSGTVTIADSVVQLLRNGVAYVDIHTDAHPAGEIRGNLTAASHGHD